MNGKKALRLAVNLAVLAAFLVLLGALWRPSFTAEMARNRAERRYGSFFTGEVIRLPVIEAAEEQNKTAAAFAGQIGEAYGVILVKREGVSWKSDGFYILGDQEESPLLCPISWDDPSDDWYQPIWNRHYVVGRVQDPDIVRVEVICRNMVDKTATSFVTTEEFYDGVFVLRTKWPLEEYILTAYSRTGDVIYRERSWDEDMDSSWETHVIEVYQ